ncbi:MAG: RS21-C6 protein [Bernardetiaceae bacterium]|jgi:NTP pyrophosphatase (non-canonical NTP hydrolase)|nr:RS21-C6 protein [Bernardetiaceae bacterium]
MATLQINATLPDYQAYLKALCEERGWTGNTDLELYLLFAEEVGELAKAIRRRRKLYIEPSKAHKPDNLEEEFADVFGYLLDLANHFNIDLEQAFRNKEAINAQRVWH